MCKYCERRTDVKYWDQPFLPYHGNIENCESDLNGNIADFDKFEGHIYDYQSSTPELVLTCKGYFNGTGIGTIYIPIKYCPECGRKLGGLRMEEKFSSDEKR